jgi:peptidyl-prolyl cis-trans isomerase NIMA-interacting 1
MRQLVLILALSVVACGGKHKGDREAKSASGRERTEHRDDSPGTKCIDEAKTARTPPTEAPERMDLAQILVRHAGVRDAGDVYRTREEACLRAMEARQKLLAGGDWDEVFKEYSDAKGATQGVLYDVTQGSLDPAFAGAAFSLAVDELSYVVETKRGFHIIWRKK